MASPALRRGAALRRSPRIPHILHRRRGERQAGCVREAAVRLWGEANESEIEGADAERKWRLSMPEVNAGCAYEGRRES